MVNALVTDAFEIFDVETNLLIGVEKLSRAAAGIPFRLKFRQQSLYATEINLVAALVRARVSSEIDLAVRHGPFDNPRDIANLIVFVGATDIERLVVNAFARGVNNGDEGSRNIFNVDERTPGSAVALQIDAPRGDGPGHEVVDYQVKAQTGRDAVGGGIAHVCRAE